MKRTTYIFIGVFIAGIIIATSHLLYIKSVIENADEMNYTFSFGQQRERIDLSDVHTLQFSAEGVEPDEFYFMNSAKVDITSSANENEKVISYPVSDYLKINKEDGVLKVILDLTSENFKNNKPGIGRGLSLENLNINIEINKELKSIHGSKGFEVTLEQIQLDSLYLVTKSAEIKSCEIRSLVLDSDTRFKGNTSQINDLYIDLDNIDGWDIKESKVNTLHLTGSRKYQNHLSSDQYNQLLWEPKNENAELKVTLKGKSQITMN